MAANIPFKSGSSGIWRTKSALLLDTIASGASGDVVYTAPAGQLVRFNYLAVQANGLTQSGVGVKADSTVIVANKLLINANFDVTVGTFGILSNAGGTFVNRVGASIPQNVVGETVTVTRVDVTTQIIEVGIEYGVIE